MYKKCPLYVWQCNQGTKNNGMAMSMGMLLGQVLSEIFMIELEKSLLPELTD